MEHFSIRQYALAHKRTLGGVYKRVWEGRLPAVKVDGQWRILASKAGIARRKASRRALMKTNNAIKRSMSHLDSASNLLAEAAEVAPSEVHTSGLRRLSVGLALLRAPLARIGAELQNEQEFVLTKNTKAALAGGPCGVTQCH